MKYLLLMSIAALSVGLSGCGSSSADAEGDSSAPLCLDTAQPFEYPVATFVVTENLDRSSSWDYLKGIQYVSGGVMDEADIKAIIVLMEDKVKEFAVYDGVAADGITSLNNAIDTMEEVVAAEDTAGNIQNGKIQIEGAIRDGVTCSYNNRAAVLRNETNDDTLFYILDYSYTSGTNRLARTIAYYTETTITDLVTGEDKTTNSILATSLSALNPDTFITSGYNAPLASTIQWGDSDSSLSLTMTKDYQERTDRAAYVSAAAFTVGDNDKVKRFKISVDYETAEAKIYTSNFVSAVTCHPGTADEVMLPDPTVDELKAHNCENLKDENDVVIREAYKDSGYDITDIDPEVPDSGTPPTPIETYTATFVDGR